MLALVLVLFFFVVVVQSGCDNWLVWYLSCQARIGQCEINHTAGIIKFAALPLKTIEKNILALGINALVDTWPKSAPKFSRSGT